MRRHIRNALRVTRDAVIGSNEPPIIDELIRRDPRWSTFLAAVEFVNYERVAGEIVEFGVFTGISLALLAKAYSFDPKGMTRRLVGFDSFDGLPSSLDEHARWSEGACRTNHSWHPLLPEGARVTPQATRDLFDVCELPAPRLHAGRFEETAPPLFPSTYRGVALVHVDCDLYESTKTALDAIAPALQDGTVLLFDDWFHYRGNPSKGEARAFLEFLDGHPEWTSVHYRSYSTFCNAFILSRR
jgi:O-methyltransferase